MRRVHDLREEPTGAAYELLLRCGSAGCSEGLVVLRDGLEVAASAQAVIDALTPFVIQRGRAARWPGTELFEHTAEVIRFRYDAASRALLTGAATRLFAWQQPALPEDLCLLRPDGSPWLTTVVHERDAYLELEPGEAEALRELGLDV